MSDLNKSSIVEYFFSDDVDLIRQSAFGIIHCWDRQQLKALAAQILPNLDKRPNIKLGGGLIPNSHWVDVAVYKLELSQVRTCLCHIVFKSQFFDPEKLQNQGQCSILTTEISAEAFSSSYDCRCNTCQQSYKVKEEAGWHVPWYEWVAKRQV